MIKRGKLNKKGISPLIATVLIVGFTIALAGVAYFFLSDTVKEQIDKQGAEGEGKSKCIGVDVSFVECSDKIVKFKNGGKEGVAGFTFRLKKTDASGNADYTTKQLQESIEAGDEREYTLSGVTSEGGDAIPLVPAKGYAYPCADKIITFECQ